MLKNHYIGLSASASLHQEVTAEKRNFVDMTITIRGISLHGSHIEFDFVAVRNAFDEEKIRLLFMADNFT